MTETGACPLPAWEPHIAALRAVGLDARVDTVCPGWWFIQIDLATGDIVFVGSKTRPDDDDAASIDPEGPGDYYLAYRQHEVDDGKHCIQSVDTVSEGRGMHDLLFVVAGAIIAPLRDYQAW